MLRGTFFLSILALGFGTFACSGGDETDGGNNNLGGSGSGAAPGSGGSAATGGGGSTSGTGGTTSADCRGFGDTPPAGVSILYEPTQGTFGGVYTILGYEDGTLFVADGTEVKAVPSDGGAVTTLLTFEEGSAPWKKAGDYFVYRAANTDQNLVDISAAALDDTTQTKTAVATIPAYTSRAYATKDFLLWQADAPVGIWKAPWTGGGGAEFVPDAEPLEMLEHNGYVYWLDFATDQLSRVPNSGGPKEDLIEVFFGGAMAAEGNNIYHADSSLNVAKKFTLGETTDVVLFTGDVFDAPELITAKDGTAYFTVGTFCNFLYSSSGPDTAKRLVNGFDNADFVQATPNGIVVGDNNAIYIVSE